MYKFKRVYPPSAIDIYDFNEIVKLCKRYRYQLFDDFAFEDTQTFLERIIKLITESGQYFWIIRTKRENEFVGFIYLYDVVGRNDLFTKKTMPWGASIGTCFVRKFWGAPVFNCGEKFLKHCFLRLGFKKLKCETFRSNQFIAGLLGKLGFEIEGELLNETMLDGKAENLLLWGLCEANWRRRKILAPKNFAKQKLQQEKGACPRNYTSRSINNGKIIPILGKKENDC